MAKVFISYKRNVEPDTPIATAIYESLRNHHDVFIDTTIQVGEKWAERIQQEIKSSDYFIACLSENSVNSEMVIAEIETAHHQHKAHGRPVILPVRLGFKEDLAYPLSAYLNSLQWAFWKSPADTSMLIAQLKQAIEAGKLPASREEVTGTIKNENLSFSPFAGPPRDPGAAEGTMPHLSHLPQKAYHRLIGRLDELDRTMHALRDPHRKPIVAIIGLGGIGKTALAQEVMDQCRRDRIFDHYVWASAKPERFVGEGIVKTEISDYNFERLLRDVHQQCTLAIQAGKYSGQLGEIIRSFLSEKRVLVVMDNLETVIDSESLIDSIFQILGNGKLLITGRHHVKHEQAYTVELGGFPEEEGIMFLREESKERGIPSVADARRESLVAIHHVTGGAPLAMKLVIGQMSRQPMNVVLEELKAARFSGQDYDFYRFVFKHSWDMLDMDAKKVLVSMSIFPPGIGGKEDAVMTVGSVDKQAFYLAMDKLVIMSLVECSGQLESRRYSIHQLTHYFILSDIVKKWG